MIKQILKNISLLQYGTYNKIINNDEIIIKVSEKNNKITINYKNKNNLIFIINYYKESDKYEVIKFIDAYATKHENKYIEILDKKYKYTIKQFVISKKDKNNNINKNYIIDDNKIHYKIDNNTVIEKDLDNNKYYIYLKKYNSKTDNFYFKEEWIKIEYNEDNLNSIINYNENITSKLKNISLENSKLKELINTINIPKNSPFIKEEISELENISDLYNKYKEELYNNNDMILNEISEFISYLNNNRPQAKLNALSNYIKENNLDDLDILEKIKKQIISIIKIKKKEKTKKLSKKYKNGIIK